MDYTILNVGETGVGGLAGLPDDGTNDEDLISVADARLFEAKRNGRNQIVVSKTVEL